MAKVKKPKPSEAERLLESKRRLIKRLRGEIFGIRDHANARIEKVESRIRIAQTIADALERGTLKP